MSNLLLKVFTYNKNTQKKTIILTKYRINGIMRKKLALKKSIGLKRSVKNDL